MWELKACTVCLTTEGKLINIATGPLKRDFYVVSGLKADDSEGALHYLCVECSAHVRRFKKFRDKCNRGHYTLKTLMKSKEQVNKSTLNLIKREKLGLSSTLSFLDLKKTHYEETAFQWVKNNRIYLRPVLEIPTFHCSTIQFHDFEVPITAKTNLTNLVEEVKEESVETAVEIDIVNEPTFGNDAEGLLDDHYDDPDSDNDDRAVEKAAGSDLDVEYANMVPISLKEARAALEVYKMFSNGKHRCECGKAFYNEKRLEIHKRMHDQHLNGSHICSLCNYCYKTDFLLKTHMTEKHMYKYVCRKCPEVNFDRTSAKQHFIFTHLQKGSKKNANWYESRPSWMSNKGGKRHKGVVTLRPVKKNTKLPDDFLVYSPVSHEEQFALVQQRRKSRNYLEANFKCEYCFRGFREAGTYGKHMRKHDPAFAGPLQCDMCKLHFKDTRRMYKHMNITHLFKYSCQSCPFVCYNRGQAQMHYKWHKNVKYPCPHCEKEFAKASTRLTHIRIKHPSMYICNLCGHSFVSENGLYCHKKLAHSPQEIEQSESVSKMDPDNPQYCGECGLQFASAAAYDTHLGSSGKHAAINTSIKPVRSRASASGANVPRRSRGRPRNGSSEIVNTGVPTATTCEVCNEFLSNDVQARKHYEAEHPGHEFLKRYMCDVCGHTTRQYANLMVHMRTHTNEKPYGCPHCDRRFSMPSNRDRHLVVHTGEKRYQCQHCSRRFTQSSAVKLHIQTVHLKIPYAPWDKKNRKRRKELEGAGAPLAPPPPLPAPPQPKLLLHADAQGDYLSAYITYNDE